MNSAAPLTRRELREREALELARSRGARPRRERGAGPRRRPRRVARRDRAELASSIGKRLFSLTAMLFSGALVVGLTVPANAINPPGVDADALATALTAQEVQAFAVEETVAADAPARADWGVTSWAEVLRQRYGTQNYSYSVGSGPIRWPFPFPVPISDGWGERVAPCRGCSSYHQGVDFIPGSGQPIYAIADGVVTAHDERHWSYGNTVEIEHDIDGQVVTSKYAHMQRGSSPLQVGDEVEVGDFIGLVGSTGTSTGPHLHLEIWLDGVKVNPFTWLKAKAG